MAEGAPTNMCPGLSGPQIHLYCRQFFKYVPTLAPAALQELDLITTQPVTLLGDNPHAANMASGGTRKYHTQYLPPWLASFGLIVDVLVYATYDPRNPTATFRIRGVECLAAYPRKRVPTPRPGQPIWWRRTRPRLGRGTAAGAARPPGPGPDAAVELPRPSCQGPHM
jgi:hypothetical protein